MATGFISNEMRVSTVTFVQSLWNIQHPVGVYTNISSKVELATQFPVQFQGL
jgi:hypothetical protein